jgi:glycosyltransferase involved in cell wall biosynthesis
MPLVVWPQGISAAIELPLRALGKGFDFMLTQNFSPAFGRSAVFIQDVLFRTNPEWFTLAERLYFPLMIRSAPHAQVIFASTGSEAARIAGVIPQARRIEQVGLGISSELTNAVPLPPNPRPGIGQYLLTVGRLNIRKNVEFTCEAALASGRVSPAFPLVIAGTPHGKSSAFSSRVQAAVKNRTIVFIGRVTNSELAWLYSNAATFIFMTHGEGFGLPPLEALSFGSPVIASDIPVMREVLGGNARFVKPGRIEELVRAIREVDVTDAAEDRDARTRWGEGRFTYSMAVTRMRECLASLIRA